MENRDVTYGSERVLPTNTDAEESVLGAMLYAAEALEIAGEMLVPEDFYYEKHRTLFRSMRDMFDSASPPDPLLLANSLKAMGLLESVGDKEYLITLMNGCPNPYNVEYYAKLVKEASNKRKVIETGHKVISGAYGSGEAEDLLAELQEVVNDPILGTSVGGSLVSECDRLPDFFDNLVAKQTGGDFTGLDTGFQHLNRIVNGLNPGLMVWGGSPSCGKTTLAVHLAHNVAELNGIPVLYYSLDQNEDDLRIRTISRLSRIENRKLFRGRLDKSSKDISALAEAMDEYRELSSRIYLFGPGYDFSIEKMKLTARRVMREHNAEKCFIVVDYLQKVYPSKNYRSEYERMNIVINQFSSTAGDLKCPLLVISEVSRAGYDKKSMKAFKDSGRIEYGADVAGILVSEGPLNDNPRLVNLHIIKNRMGEKATIKFDLWLDLSSFDEVGSEDLKEEDQFKSGE